MSNEFDSQASYNVYEPDEDKCGEIVKGVFTWRTGEPVGTIVGDQLFEGDRVIGRVEGLSLVRFDPPGEPETRFTLVLQE